MKYLKEHKDFDFNEDDFDIEEENPNENLKVGDKVNINMNKLHYYVKKRGWPSKMFNYTEEYVIKRIYFHSILDEKVVNLRLMNGHSDIYGYYFPLSCLNKIINESFDFNEDDFDFNEDDFDFEEYQPINKNIGDYVITYDKSIQAEEIAKKLKTLNQDVYNYGDIINHKENNLWNKFTYNEYDKRWTRSVKEHEKKNKIIISYEQFMNLNESFDFNEDDFDFEEFDDIVEGDKVKVLVNGFYFYKDSIKIVQKFDSIKNYTKTINSKNHVVLLSDKLPTYEEDFYKGRFINKRYLEKINDISKNENFDFNENDFDFEEEGPNNWMEMKENDMYNSTGKIVMIKPDTRYYFKDSSNNPINIEGTILTLISLSFIRVLWSNGIKNSYHYSDLLIKQSDI